MNNLESAINYINNETFKPVKATQVMATAWLLAKDAARQFNVSSKALLSAALKKVWSRVLVTVSVFNGYDKRVLLAKKGFVFNKLNKAWEIEVRKEVTHWATGMMQMLAVNQQLKVVVHF